MTRQTLLKNILADEIDTPKRSWSVKKDQPVANL